MKIEALFLGLSELPRAMIERLLFAMSEEPGGIVDDGRPVVLIPGLGGSDTSMNHLKYHLLASGFDTRYWGLGINAGQHVGDPVRLVDRIAGIAKETGQKVTLIGWSLGGILARTLATDHPHMVREVITLGSPFSGDFKLNNIWRIISLFPGVTETPEMLDFAETLARPIPVPALSIYSKRDGVVYWRNCLDPSGFTDEVEVNSSHLGIVYSPEVFEIIVDRLTRPAPALN